MYFLAKASVEIFMKSAKMIPDQPVSNPAVSLGPVVTQPP